jgi:superfamily I DNA/RNA helicase
VVEMLVGLSGLLGCRATADPLFPRLLETAEPFGKDVESFLALARLGRGVDLRDPRRECVSLMTIHAAKGLEFTCVFVVGCEDGLLPFHLLTNRTANTPEERRLLYVAMTRARALLFLTHARRRTLYGKTHTLARSPFLEDIDRELSQNLRPRSGGPYAQAAERQLSLF